MNKLFQRIISIFFNQNTNINQNVSTIKIYHIDTGVLGKLVLNDSKCCKLDLFLKSQNAAILLTDLLMYEILKNSHIQQIEQILRLLNKTTNKVYLNDELIALHWIEIVDYYELGRPKTPSEFKRKFIKQFEDNTEWIKYVEQMRLYSNELKADGQWTNDWVFGKMISKYGKERKRKPLLVKDILNASGTKVKPLDLTKFHKLIDSKIDTNNYFEYEKDILNQNNSGGFSKFQKDVLEWINKSMLSFDDALKLTVEELNERVFYAEQLENASDLLSDKNNKNDFFKTMLQKFGQRISDNKIIEEKMIEKRQMSESKVRASDPYDINYLLLLPYIDLLTCDKNTHNEITQIIRDNKLTINAIIDKNEDFYQKIIG